MSADLHEDVASQLTDVSIRQGQPLLICDADEVMVQFVSALEAWMKQHHGLYLDLKSLAITGNVKRIEDNVALSGEEVGQLLANFFAEGMEHQTAVPGAADALARLSSSIDIVVLSNVPPQHREKRVRGLMREGFDYPVIANAGAKGPVAKLLAAQAQAPVYFIDDLPPNHISVGEHVPSATLIHFMADARLNKLMPTAPGAHLRADDWAHIEQFIRSGLQD